jgi:hypothetical protein
MGHNQDCFIGLRNYNLDPIMILFFWVEILNI